MSKFDSDALDTACEEVMGHTNWAYLHTLTPAQKKELPKDAMVVVFFKENS